jgi:peptide-methionine (S)-S-oxide reductase
MRTLLTLAVFLVALAAATLVARGGAAAETVVPPTPAEVLAPHAGQPEAKVVLAGGCFWCTELGMEAVRGVSTVVSGYAGGSPDDANYEAVANGRTDHAEAIEVTYDPSQITLGEILQAFFVIHDPTQLNRQTPDVGRQYRTALFYADDAEKQAMRSYLDQLQQAYGETKVVTTLESLTQFHRAEEYHQDFVAKNPNHPYVVRWAYAKPAKLREHLPELAKSASP